jgi:hypothetical protein
MKLKVVLNRFSCYLYNKLSKFLQGNTLKGKPQTPSACTVNNFFLRHRYRFINGIPEPGGLLWLKHAAKLQFDDTSSKFRLKHKNFKNLLHGVLFF